ncbi:hypothetical protein AVEN_8093-1 [Araneus ventricosus]|uniref:Uncharacterized protein n=1 Tax=Araneus ventricosus TaxID=182803 RepID=A0A4Y2LWK9_ARAVE|nr:hypothetical protein AVEN_8093-1 [Araneus ventricosus]
MLIASYENYRYFNMVQHQKKHLSVLRSPSSKISSLNWAFTINSIHPDPIHLEGFLAERFHFQLIKFGEPFTGQRSDCANWNTKPKGNPMTSATATPPIF